MTKVRTVLAVFLGLFAVLTLLDRFVLVELLLRRTTIPLLLAIAIALAMLPLAALLRRTTRVDLPLDLLIGYPLFGTVLFLVGLLKISAWTVVPALVVCAAGGVALLLRRYADTERTSVALPPWNWSVLAIAIILGCAIVEAQAPASSLDELTYHLAVPHTWVLEGRVVELPLNSHSYFPFGIGAVDVLPLLLLGASDGSVASHLLHLFAAVATIVLIARRTQSWLATAAVATTPALALTAGWSLVEWPLAGQFVALYIALESDDRDTASAATAAGLLTKYTFAPFALVAWAVKRRMPRWTVVVGGVFLLYNLVRTGNPVAPFFEAAAPAVSQFRELALADYIFEGTFVDEALGASMLTLSVFTSGAVAAASIALAIALFLLAPSARILVPFLIAPAISAAPALRKRAVAVLVGAAVVVQTFLVVWFTHRGDAFSLLAGTATEQEHLRKQRVSYATTEWINATLPKRSRPLVIGQSESFWFSHPTRAVGNFDGPRMSAYLALKTPEALRQRLRADGITHVVLVSLPVATSSPRRAEERRTTLSPPAQRMLSQTLDRYVSNITTHRQAIIFTLRP